MLVEVLGLVYLFFWTVDLAGAIPVGKFSAVMKLNHFGQSIQDAVAHPYTISIHSGRGRRLRLLICCAPGLAYARCMRNSMKILTDP